MIVNETEQIAKTNKFATKLKDITTPGPEPFFARDIDFSVNITSNLNRYLHTYDNNVKCNAVMYVYSVTETNFANLIANDADTFINVSNTYIC